MAFDAGKIVAELILDDSDFDRRLRADVARIEEFEKRSHEVKLGVEMDESGMRRAQHQFEQFDRRVTADAQRRSRSSSGSILGVLAGMSRSGGGAASGTAAGGGGGLLRGLAGGAGPGILGIGARGAGIIGAGGAALGALPALAGVGGAGAIAGIGASVIGMGASQLIGTKNKPGQAATEGPLFQQAQALGKTLKDTMKTAAEGMLGPLRQAFSAIPGILHSLAPALHGLFAGAGTMIMPLLHGITDIARVALPLLGQAFRAVSPLVRPLLDGLAMLLKGILPGLITLLHAAHPAITAFAQVLGILGRDLGGMFKAMAPAISASSVILKALGGVLGALFPIIGRLAAIFAKTLAPVFNDLARVIQSLMPTLVIVGRVFASLAGAVLTDLVAAFGALAKLLVLISPSFKILAQALSSVFTILENSGVFGVLANALEQMVPSLAKLINSLVRGIVPVLPVVIRLFAQLVTLLAAGTARALGDIATALADIIDAIPPKMLRAIVLGVLALVAAFKAMAIINVILAALSANPIILIAAACALLVIGIVELVKHWKAVWGEVKRIAADAWHFIYDGIGKYLLPLLGPVGLIALGAIEMARHWTDIWNGIVAPVISGVQAVLRWVTRMRHDIADIYDGIRHDIASAWDTIWNNTIGRLIRGGHDVEAGFNDLRHRTASIYDGVRHDIAATWDTIWNNTIGRLERGVSDAVNQFANLRDNIAGKFDTIKRNIANVWDTIWDNTAGRTIRGVAAIGHAIDVIKSKWDIPIHWVIQYVINDGLIKAFNAISGVVHGPHIDKVDNVPWAGMQRGGRLPGFGGGDRNPALLEDGETVVSKESSVLPFMRAAFMAAGVPGYARGGLFGYKNPLRGISGLQPERVDMGVDYGGFGPVYAVGPGIIKNVYNSGWPGGTFISELMTSGPAAGRYIYEAETSYPQVSVGQRVDANTITSDMHGPASIEIGWALPPGRGTTMAAAAGQASSHGDPGSVATAYGASFSNFMRSLGAPGGIISGPISGHTGKGFFSAIGGFFASLTSKAGRFLSSVFSKVYDVGKIMAALSSGNAGALTNAFYALMGHKTGGPPDAMSTILANAPGMLVKSAVRRLLSIASALTGGGAVPGPGERGYITAMLRDMSAPADAANITSMATWGRREFPSWPPSASWNLMATTQSAPGATDFNSVGVKNYPSAQVGARANAQTLMNGLYPNILAALRSGKGLIGNGSIAGELLKWSGGGYSSLDSGGWLLGPPNYTGKPEAVLTPPQSAAYVRMAEAAEAATRGGGGGAGSMMRDLNLALSLPEGTTVAQALRELSWALRVARQQSFTG